MGNPKHQEKIVGKGMRTRVNEEQQCRLPRAEQSDEIRNPRKEEDVDVVEEAEERN